MPRSQWGRSCLEGAGAALLMAPGLTWLELSPSDLIDYHRLLPLTTVDRALAVDLALLSVLGTLAVLGLEALVARRGWPAWRGTKSYVPLLWALWLSFLVARGVHGLLQAGFIRWQQVNDARAFLLVLEALFAVWALSQRWYSRTIRGLRFALMLAGFSVLWMIPSLVAASFARQPRDVEQFLRPLPAAQGSHRRIVWLLFDGMSYYELFVHRWPGLQMPNFDRLRAESVTFSDMQPDGSFTEEVIPSLFLGRTIMYVRGTPTGWMLYQTTRHAPWRPYDSDTTLFADAHREGWTTGAVGWYNPYCRLLRDQLDSCSMALTPLPDHFSRDRSTWQNAVAPISGMWEARARAKSADQDWTLLDQAGSAADTGLIGFVRRADTLIADDRIDLCFIHFPIPHPPGGYNRKTGQIEDGGSYIDNLALSDRVLGRMLDDIAKTGAADQTTLVVSSDHGWRVWYWRGAFGWTDEDEAASQHGYFDPRPTLMVRFPGETGSAAINRPVPLIGMHDLMERLMSGHVSNAEQLETWAAR